MNQAIRYQSSHRQTGLTLVEVMVAMVISLLLLGGVVQIFISSKTTYRTDTGLARLQENGRFALSFLTKDVRMAGYFGCLSKDMKITNVVKHSNGDLLYDFQQGIYGYDNVSSSFSSVSGASPVAGTDVIVVKRAGGGMLQVDEPAMKTTSATVHFVKNPNMSLEEGDIAMVSDCSDASIFQVTNDPANSSTHEINHTTAGSMTPGNTSKNLGKPYGTDATVMKAETVIYYVAPSTSDDSKSSLYQKIGSDAQQELVEGIENMQVKYGIDTDANGTADKYVAASAVSDWLKVVSVKLAILADSIDSSLPTNNTKTYSLLGTTVGPANDRLQRQVFTTTVTLRNRAIL